MEQARFPCLHSRFYVTPVLPEELRVRSAKHTREVLLGVLLGVGALADAERALCCGSPETGCMMCKQQPCRSAHLRSNHGQVYEHPNYAGCQAGTWFCRDKSRAHVKAVSVACQLTSVLRQPFVGMHVLC